MYLSSRCMSIHENIPYPDDSRLLVFSSGEGDIHEVRKLLEKGTNPNAQDNLNGTALTSATVIENIDIVKMLLERDADPNVRDKEGNSALDYALYWIYASITKLLILYGATK